MRHIINCVQISSPRAVSYNDMSDSSSQQIFMKSDSQNSSFDVTVPSTTAKGKFDFSTNASFVHAIVFSLIIVFYKYCLLYTSRCV